ncbi:MAG: hypothetical protein ACK2UB_08145 [Anaerolineales bacterium]|jgi:hypothetical protein
MGLFRYFLNLFLLAVTAWIVFRIVVRGEYRRKGSLSPLSGLLELAVWFWYMWTPNMPGKQEWGWFLTADSAPGVFQRGSGWKTRSLVVPVSVHALVNGVILLLQ